MDPGEPAEVLNRCRNPRPQDADVIARWEKAVADHVGVPHAAGVNSGRRGMTLILEHLGVGSGDEVIVPAYTLKDLIGLIEGLGAKAVPADIEAETLNLSPEACARRITPQTKAILALHAFGSPCRIDEIVSLADGHGIPVIEDCAHSLGATFKGEQTGSFGRAAFFSFETTKPVNTFGGGMVVSRDAGLIERIHASTADDPVDSSPIEGKVRATKTENLLFATGLGFPFLYLLASPSFKALAGRLYRRFQHAPPASIAYTSLQAEIGLKKLATLPGRIAERKDNAALLRTLLSPEIRTQRVAADCESTWYFFVALLPCGAGRVRKRLLMRGIDAGIADEIADDCAALLRYEDCPVVADVTDRAIALPMYDGISETAIRKVARVVNKVGT